MRNVLYKFLPWLRIRDVERDIRFWKELCKENERTSDRAVTELGETTGKYLDLYKKNELLQQEFIRVSDKLADAKKWGRWYADELDAIDSKLN